jgi:hypothetical protein
MTQVFEAQKSFATSTSLSATSRSCLYFLQVLMVLRPILPNSGSNDVSIAGEDEEPLLVDFAAHLAAILAPIPFRARGKAN